MLPEGDEGANGNRWRGYILLVVPIHTWLGSIVYQFANMVGFYWFVWYDLAPWSLAADMTHISCWRVATEPRDADWHSNLVVLTWHIPRPASATDDVRLCWRGKLYDAACIDWLTRSLLVYGAEGSGLTRLRWWCHAFILMFGSGFCSWFGSTGPVCPCCRDISAINAPRFKQGTRQSK